MNYFKYITTSGTMAKKLLIIGSNTIHTYRYIQLIEEYFDDILLLTNKKNEDYNITSIEVDFRLGLNILKSSKRIYNICKEFNPSIVHIHQANSYAFITLFALKNVSVPNVLSAWGSDVLVNPKRSFLFRWLLQYGLKNIDIATSDSLYMAHEMKNYSDNLDVRIANFGIDIEGIKGVKEKIIYSNRLHKSLYNIDKIIKNFSIFVKNNSDWKLVIAGTGDETKQLNHLAQKLSIEASVEFIGWVDSKVNNEMYQKASIYVSVPSSDATSISLLEAIASNCICFVSNLPANCEHIVEGISGYIEPNLDKIDFEKYLKINKDLLEDVNNRKKQSYVKEFNKKIFLGIYNELIKGEN